MVKLWIELEWIADGRLHVTRQTIPTPGAEIVLLRRLKLDSDAGLILNLPLTPWDEELPDEDDEDDDE